MKIIERDRFLREIFRMVLVDGPITRTELMNQLSISRASVTRFSAPLIERGVIVESPGIEVAAPGRPTRPLEINAASRSFLGFKLTGSSISAVRTDLMATTLALLEEPIESPSPASVVEQMARIASQLDPTDSYLAVGVSLGGLVTTDGVVVHEDFLGWDTVPLADMVGRTLNRPVVLENDVVALAIAEHWFGAGRGIDTFAVLTIGAGIGYGLVVKDRVIDSQRAREGLIGHLPLWEVGPRCNLGHPGCATALMANGYILDAVKTTAPEIDNLADAYESQDQRVRDVLMRSARALGRTIAEIASLGMVERVVLCGEGVGLYRSCTQEVLAAVVRYSPSRIEPPEVVADEQGFDLWARGAAAAAIQHVVLSATFGSLLK